jgi:GntR family transcriptional regulator/MocR family aminotransferase
LSVPANPRTAVDLPLILRHDAAESLTGQLIRQLRDTMRAGRLAAGERLPSSRALAATLGVSRTVVTDSYQQLYAEGWLDGRHGSGTFVADLAPQRFQRLRPSPASAPPPKHDHATDPQRAPGRRGGGKAAEATVAEATVAEATAAGDVVAGDVVADLRPGTPWTRDLSTPAWRRAWRLAAAEPDPRPDPHGLPGLRAALVGHLRRTRGIACTRSRLLITSGATSGLDLLAATILRPGDRVGVEEPGYGRARSVLAARGAEVVPCPVDEHGLIVERLPRDLRIVYTTPSHQYPLGGVLPVPRRQALVAWARRVGALIAEDDYDSEFRYDVAPLPALYGLDPEVVVYLGTTSKTVAPDMGVGWLVAGPGLIEAIARRREELADRTAPAPQHAVHVLLERGDLARHVRKMRAEYARRRAAVVAALAGFALTGDSAGLHLVMRLPRARTTPVIETAARHGVLLDSLERHYAGPVTAAGLVIGYGGARVQEIRRGCALVRELAGVP